MANFTTETIDVGVVNSNPAQPTTVQLITWGLPGPAPSPGVIPGPVPNATDAEPGKPNVK